MSSPKYPVPCECGKIHEVTGGQAGTKLTCECGKTVEVPSLVKLRASVGQSMISPDFELDQILGTDKLPVESTCGICGIETKDVMRITVICEKSQEKHDGRAAMAVMMGCFFGILGGWLIYLANRNLIPKRVIGRDVAYHLPVRVCKSCAVGHWTKELTRSVLEKTPVYQRLLTKYPKAQIRLPS